MIRRDSVKRLDRCNDDDRTRDGRGREKEEGGDEAWNDRVAYDVRNVHVTCTVKFAASIRYREAWSFTRSPRIKNRSEKTHACASIEIHRGSMEIDRAKSYLLYREVRSVIFYDDVVIVTLGTRLFRSFYVILCYR